MLFALGEFPICVLEEIGTNFVYSSLLINVLVLNYLLCLATTSPWRSLFFPQKLAEKEAANFNFFCGAT